MELNDLQHVLDKLDEVEEDTPTPNWDYRRLQKELFEDRNVSIQALNKLRSELDRAFGAYGSVNVGTEGKEYSKIRRMLTRIRTEEILLLSGKKMPMLSAFLTDPVEQLIPYKPDESGPGGQGNMKIDLNKCIIHVRDRISRALGMLLVEM